MPVASRYQKPTGTESESQPGSRGRVLRNTPGIIRKRDMDKAEYTALIAVQNRYLQTLTGRTRFTAKRLCEMHRDWLGDIYPWAGTYRTVELQKGDFVWPPAFLVAQNMANFETGLLKMHTPCRPAPLPEVAQSIAEVHAELLLIHPFREGNGRLARWFAGLMAAQAGFVPPFYRFEGKGGKAERERYLNSVIQGYRQNYAPLTGFFVDVLERAARNE